MSARRAPAYQRIADELTTRITTGEYPPGARPPTEPEMMRAYDVSSTTVRAAVRAAGGIPSQRLSCQIVPAERRYAGLLGVEAGSPLLLRRLLRSIDGLPAVVESAYHPPWLVDAHRGSNRRPRPIRPAPNQPSWKWTLSLRRGESIRSPEDRARFSTRRSRQEREFFARPYRSTTTASNAVPRTWVSADPGRATVRLNWCRTRSALRVAASAFDSPDLGVFATRYRCS
ncbi:MAG: GntR family transcriptional regulator [Dactylosporangium sp.]|nr:GntR family transcriptional regulator [Dactylosporangium sp.]NNJ61320.1 GntR family transcriptional regulator [Dactylosporangium sp.]